MQPSPRQSRSYVSWVVAALALVQMSSFADRTVIAVLQQPIKMEFKLSDVQVGLLGGLAFAAVYAILGLPIARLAERKSRRVIIACSLTVWSVTTMLCGFASSYAMLFLLRFGVGVGEAGAMPASHSLIADYVAPSGRGRAMSIFSAGAPLGAMLGFVVGGVVAQLYGWRAGFVAVGVPGLLLALIIFFSVEKPARQGAEAPSTPVERAASAASCFRTLFGLGIFRHLVLGQVLMAVPGYGIGAFAAVYLIRAFGFTLANAGLVLGVGYGISYTLGLILGGRSHDRQGFGLMPALVTLAAAPVAVASYLATAPLLAVSLMVVCSALQGFSLPPTYAAMHNRIRPCMRATAVAVMLFLTNLIGAGLGPVLVGWLSDRFASNAFDAAASSFAASCPGGIATPGTGAKLSEACHAASTVGLRGAMIVVSLAVVWAAVHYLFVARCIRQAETAVDQLLGGSTAAPAQP